MSQWSVGSDALLPPGIRVIVSESSQIGEARRAIAGLASQIRFDEVGCGKLSLLVTEAATNLIKHAGGGEIVLLPVKHDQVRGIEILALDKGPGIADVAKSLRDGFSTAGTSGTGIGAISRLADFWNIYSVPGAGTVLLARAWSKAVPAKAPGVSLASLELAVAGETVCGDGWAVDDNDGCTLVLVVDGLGHGPGAAEAARAAISAFRSNIGLDPVEIIQRIHGGLRATRGAAVAVAEIDRAQEVLHFAGVGNISGTICGAEKSRSTVSYNGTVGHEIRKLQAFVYPFPAGALLVMHSDGLSARWSLDSYPGLATRDPALIAGVLYRDFRRERDDVTVLVLREERP